jgi:N-acetylmuramoyl-L-alanine amidase
MKLKLVKSPNFSKVPRKTNKIKYVVVHYTGMQSKRASVRRLLNKKHKVSCHYFIDRKGSAIQMVDDKKVAWHAGKSKWKNIVNLNEGSIGIELVNKGYRLGYEKFPKKQIKKFTDVCIFLKKKYKIKSSNFLGHSDVAPLRKKDPGEYFPWLELSKKGIGKWHSKSKKNFKNFTKKQLRNIFFNNLHIIGYRYFDKKKASPKDISIIKAFQRRYVQKNVNGQIDIKTLKISHLLANN